MPGPSARFPHITAVLRILCAGFWLAACSGGGGGGGSAAPAGSTASGQTSSVTVAWGDAQGAVAGYSVYVQRGDGFKHEADVPQARATLHGAPGSTARVIVVAFDAGYAHGLASPSSAPFTFPESNANSQGASAANAGSIRNAAASVLPASNPVASTDPPSADSSDETPAPDLPGGALVWQSGDAFRLTNAAVEATRLFARPSDGAQLVGVADFDADGQGDLLWVSATSQLAFMPGSVLRGSGPVSLDSLGTLSAGEQVVGAGDFDGDGYGDVLVAAAGVIHARLTVPGSAPTIADLGDSAQAALAGIADFDANGSDDIAWRASTGALVLWMMDGGRATASVEVALSIDSDVIGIGDFDGDGPAEVATRDPGGNVFVIGPLAASPTFEAADLANMQGWTSMGAVDLERDRSDELVLVSAGAIRFAGLPGDQVVELDPDAPWQLVTLLP